MLKNAVLYGRIILLALPFNTLQLLFQSFFAVWQKKCLFYIKSDMFFFFTFS